MSKSITDKQRLDWLEKESRERLVSFYHPDSKFPHVRAAIDAQILKAQHQPKTKPKSK